MVFYGTRIKEHKFTKVLIINKRWFKDMDFCMMFHPYLENVLKLTILSDLKLCNDCNLQQSCNCTLPITPWEGANAMDAAVMAYANISVLGQQLKHDIYSST